MLDHVFMLNFLDPRLAVIYVLTVAALFAIWKVSRIFLAPVKLPSALQQSPSPPLQQSPSPPSPQPNLITLNLYDHTWRQRMLVLPWYQATKDIPGLGSAPVQQYVPFACHLCKRGRFTKTVLHRCKQCKIVRYCCQKHQRQDWPNHRPVCHALAKMQKFAAMFRAQIIQGNKHTYRKYIEAGSVYLHCSKQISNLAQTNVNAVQVWNRQPHCALCFTSVSLTKSCSRCHGVSLCTLCYKKYGDKGLHAEHSRNVCEQWQMFTAVQGHASECGRLVFEASDEPCIERFVPKNWDDFFAQHETMTMRRYAPKMCMLADGLSTPLSLVAHIDSNTSCQSEENMVIHLVGASVDETQHLERYCEIPNCLPSLKTLKIVLIGPNIPKKRCATNCTLMRSPERCQVSVDIVSCPYEQFLLASNSNNSTQRPTVVMAQHSGCEDLAWSEAWKPAIHLLAKLEVPCIFTGYVEKESIMGMARLKAMNVRVTKSATCNPFRGLTPLPDAAHDGFYYVNASYFCFQGYM